MSAVQIKAIWPWLHSSGVAYALALLLAGLVASKFVGMVFARVLQRLVKRTAWEFDDQMVTLLHRPVQATVVLVSGLWALQLVKALAPSWRSGLAAVLKTLLILLWAFALVRIWRGLMKGLIQRKRHDSSLVQALPLLDNLVAVLLVVGAGFMLLSLWQVNVTPLLASAGIVTAAVAFAAKDTLANFFGGVSIFVDRPYRLGDYIILDSGERGEVVAIGVRSTRIKTRDDVLISIPNAVMATAKVVNETAPAPRYRLRAKVGVAYGSDPDQVEKVLLSAVEGVESVMAHPEPRVRFRAFGDSALEYELLCWLRDPAQRGLVLHQINRNIFYRLQEAGVEIPFPQRVVHLAGRHSNRDQEME